MRGTDLLNHDDARPFVIPVSGGVDSTCALFLYDKHSENLPKRIAMFIDYGQRFADFEKRAIQRIARIDQRFAIEDECRIQPGHAQCIGPKSFIPARNMAIASIAVLRHNACGVAISSVKDDFVSDKGDAAYEIMSSTLTKFSTGVVTVISTVGEYTKGELVGAFLRSGGDPAILQATGSCYSPVSNIGHCGECPACLRRYVALESNGIPAVNRKLGDRNVNRETAVKTLARIHGYDLDRMARTIMVLGRKVFNGIISVDVDGTLTKKTTLKKTSESWTQFYERQSPSNNVIRRVNQLERDGALIVLNTARMAIDREVTSEWLRRNKVRYHVLLMGKPCADLLLDDVAEKI